MLVENTEERVLGASDVGGVIVLLRPGINNVPDEQWGRVKDKKPFKPRLGDTIQEVGKSPPEEKGLADKTPLEALKIVKSTLDLALLDAWLDKERRKKVRDSIVRQITILEAGRRKEPAKTEE